MQISLNIPDSVASQIAANETDLTRAALEALALEGYRNEKLSESEIRQMLGYETRLEVHEFLKEHGAWPQYSIDDMSGMPKFRDNSAKS